MPELEEVQSGVISNIQRFSGYAEEAPVEAVNEVIDSPVEQVTEEAITTEAPLEETPIVTTEEKVTTEITNQPIADIDPFEKLGIQDPEHKDYLAKVVSAFKDGKLNEFLEKTQVDYDTIDDAEMLKISLKREYPKADDKTLKVLIERKLSEYNITGLEGNEEEDEKGSLLLKLHTDKVREELKAEQSQYKTKAFEHQPSAEEIATQQRYEEFKEFINKSQDIELLERSKVIDFGELKADLPSDLNIRELAINPLNVFDRFFDKNGKMNVIEFSKAMYAMTNYDKMLKDAMSLATSKAEKKHFDSLRGNEGGAHQAAATVQSSGKIQNIRRD